MIRLYFFLFLFATSYLSAQSFDRFPVDFTINSAALSNALVGGINTPQLSKADFNNDGIEDLYIFDRAANVHLCFLHDGVMGSMNYTFAPEFAEHFPTVEHFVLMRDYNNDGVMDIFSYSDTPGISGMTVFEGYYEDDTLHFRRFPFPMSQDFQVVYFPLRSGTPTPLYVALNDYPAVDDVDGDGDLDILTFNASGGYLESYLNQSVERGYGLDSLIYEVDDLCWGGFFESGITPAVDLSEQQGLCFDASQSVETRHAGSTVLSLSLNGDCAKEVILGDLSFENLIALYNGGDCDEAWIIEQDLDFPSYDTPATIDVFPAAFHLDLDNDGIRDLAVTPNDADNSEDDRSIWWYQNTGTDDTPIFNFQTTSFLTETVLDLGSGSHPTFYDYNADGLMDIVVGTVGYFVDSGNRDARLFLFENVGTKTAPSFELVDDNWLNFRQFNDEFGSFSPTFGDLDGDGDEDLLVGEITGSLLYVENLGGVGQPFRAGTIQPKYAGIDIGSTSTPVIVDVDQDGKMDLLIGERNGNINFFPNIGTPQRARFETDVSNAPNLQIFGRIDAREPGFITGWSHPTVVKTLTERIVVTGTSKGQLESYLLPDDNFEAEFVQMSPLLGNVTEGKRSAAAFADLNNDGKLEMLVGNFRGGLAMYQTDYLVDTMVDTDATFAKSDFFVFPNPTRGQVEWEGDREVDQVKIYNTLGELMLEQSVSGQSYLDLPKDWSRGIYFVAFFNDNKSLNVERIQLY
ncbi:MAG: FG-GAP-like repeat-containing protein [Bacteroidota bacterium]